MKRRAFFDDPENQPALKKTTTIPRSLTTAQSVAVRREVNKQLSRKADYKQTTQSRSAYAVDNSGWVQDLFGRLSRGDSPIDQYNGSSIQVKSIHVRGMMARADTTNIVRIMVLQWYDNGVPAASGLINDTSTIAAPFGSRYWTNKRSFKVLRDITLYSEQYNGDQVLFDFYISGKKIRQTWFSTTVDNPAQRNGICLMAVSDSSIASHPTLTYRAEVIYTDNE